MLLHMQLAVSSNIMILRPPVLAYQQARYVGSTHASLGNVQPKAFGVARRGPESFVRGAGAMVSATKKVLVPVANGSEEIEAVMFSPLLASARTKCKWPRAVLLTFMQRRL